MTGALLLAAAIAGALAPPPPLGRAEARPAEVIPRDIFDAGGEVSLLVDWLPRRDVVELRPRVVADVTFDPTGWLRFHVEGLV